MLRSALVSIALISILLPVTAPTQVLQEIVVSGSRSEEERPPAKFLRRHGDFLLLRIRLTNDSREPATRESEIYATLRNILSDARRADAIAVSLVTNDDLVIPLTTDNYRVELEDGYRPDTSATNISIKTPIQSVDADGQVLTNRLRSFVDEVDAEGRTELIAEGDVQISVVGPHQYRDSIIEIFAADVKTVTESLGDNYRVIVDGIDRPVQWYRVSLLELALYVPYSYVVIPETVTSYLAAPDYE